MRKIESVFSITGLAGIAFILLEVPGGGLIAALSLMTLSFFYLFFGFIILNEIRTRKVFQRESYIGLSPWRLVFSVITGCILSQAAIGLLFTVQIWEGAGLMSMIALAEMGMIAVTGLVLYGFKISILSNSAWLRLMAYTFLMILAILYINPIVTKRWEKRHRLELPIGTLN